MIRKGIGRVVSILACFVLLLSILGCERRRENQELFSREDDGQYVLTIVFDLSGSFAHLMADNGKGYEFALLVMDHYFRDRIGKDDKIIIAQISGTDRSLLWQGTPAELRREFPTAETFRQFLMTKADSRGSLVHDGITHALNYVLSEPSIASGNAKSAVFVLSDMVDNGPDTDQSKRKTADALMNYGKQGGVVGLYYVDQMLVPVWRRQLRDAGIRTFCVESEIVGNPTLPSFD